MMLQVASAAGSPTNFTGIARGAEQAAHHAAARSVPNPVGRRSQEELVLTSLAPLSETTTPSRLF